MSLSPFMSGPRQSRPPSSPSPAQHSLFPVKTLLLFREILERTHASTPPQGMIEAAFFFPLFSAYNTTYMGDRWSRPPLVFIDDRERTHSEVERYITSKQRSPKVLHVGRKY